MTPDNEASRAEAGFSLVEALAAMAFLAAALLPLYALSSRSAELAARIERRSELTGHWRTAEAQLAAINPMVECEGERDFGAFVLTWTCEPMSGAARTRASGGSPMALLAAGLSGDDAAAAAPEGAFTVRLYRLDLTLTDARGADSRAVSCLGWRRLSPPG